MRFSISIDHFREALTASLMYRFLFSPCDRRMSYKSLSSFRLMAVVDMPTGLRPLPSRLPPLCFFVGSILFVFSAKLGQRFRYILKSKLNFVKAGKILIKVYTRFKFKLYLCSVIIEHLLTNKRNRHETDFEHQYQRDYSLHH